MKRINFIVEEANEGTRLDVFLAEQLELSRSQIAKIIAEGAVTIGDVVLTKNFRICANESIQVMLSLPAPLECVAQDIPLDFVYQDEHLAIINKPKGLVVHPGPGNPDGTLVNALLHHLKDSLSGINGIMRPGIVHRLDKDTSGLLVVAKSDAAHVALSEQLKSRTFSRRYTALICGSPKSDGGTIRTQIGRHKTDRLKMAVLREGGREAISHWQVVARYPGFTHINVQLETGRTHQIRVHMSALGHPVVGDTLYGGGTTLFERQNRTLIDGQCLHAQEIAFIHPISGEERTFTSDLPPYFGELLGKLESNT